MRGCDATGSIRSPDYDAEAAADLRGRAHRARLIATGILSDQAARRLPDYADELEAQAAALEPTQVVSNRPKLAVGSMTAINGAFLLSAIDRIAL